MNEVLYDQNSLLVAGILLASMALSTEVGYRIGRSAQAAASEPSKAHVNAILGSLLGILALVLAFTFSISLQRFDSRSEAVIDETNAIGTAYLRAQLIPTSSRSEVQTLLQDYINLRVEGGAIALDNEAQRQVLVTKANQVLDSLWSHARRAAEEDGRPVTSGLFIQSLNDLIDSYGRHEAALDRHVPEVVLFLLYGTFLVSGGVVGYAAGVSGHRPSSAAYILIALIVTLTFLIIDLDRPRRGLIRVDQRSLINLKAAIDTAQTVGIQQSAPADIPRPAVTGRR